MSVRGWCTIFAVFIYNNNINNNISSLLKHTYYIVEIFRFTHLSSVLRVNSRTADETQDVVVFIVVVVVVAGCIYPVGMLSGFHRISRA